MAAPTAGSPDAVVLSLPVVADPVDQAPQRNPQVVGDQRAVLVVQVDRVQELAVDVELELADGIVADPDRDVILDSPRGCRAAPR